MLELVKELQSRIEKLEKTISRILRVGKVVAVDGEKALVRVQFQDTDTTISDWIPVLMRFSGNDRTYSMPSEGDQVLCVFLPNAPELGFVLGQNYTDSPPTTDKEIFAARLSDGSYFEFNKKTSHLKIEISDGNYLIYDGKWRFKGDVEVEGNVKASEEISDWNGAHGSLNSLRQTYNVHTHNCDSCTTNKPNEQVE